MTSATRIARLRLSLTAILPNAIPYDGECFRCVSPAYSRVVDVFSGAGSQYVSGRYHLKGTFLIIYASTQASWALEEYCATARSSGFRVSHLLPVVTAAARLKVSVVLDLTDAAVRKQLNVTRKALVQTDWSTAKSETITQLIGRLAYELGYEALLVPSSDKRTNILVLKGNLSPTSIFEPINPDKFPKNP